MLNQVIKNLNYTRCIRLRNLSRSLNLTFSYVNRRRSQTWLRSYDKIRIPSFLFHPYKLTNF